MQDRQTVQSSGSLVKICCGQCGTSALIPSGELGVTKAGVEAAGWADCGELGYRCPLDFELGKETRAEAAAAYDEETCQRFSELTRRLGGQGLLTSHALRLGFTLPLLYEAALRLP